MDVDAKFLNDLKNALLAQGLELPWQDEKLARAFWDIAPELTVDQAVRMAKAVMAGYEFGIAHGKHLQREDAA